MNWIPRRKRRRGNNGEFKDETIEFFTDQQYSTYKLTVTSPAVTNSPLEEELVLIRRDEEEEENNWKGNKTIRINWILY